MGIKLINWYTYQEIQTLIFIHVNFDDFYQFLLVKIITLNCASQSFSTLQNAHDPLLKKTMVLDALKKVTTTKKMLKVIKF